MKRSVIVILAILLFTWSCEKTENISVIPEIHFESFTADYKETSLGEKLVGTLTFSFIDGDGDIGFIENSMEDPQIDKTQDMFVTEYEKKNGEYSAKELGPYYLRYFEEGVYKKDLKGQIEVFLIRGPMDSDTVYYEFYIMDRSNHKSNIETTPVFIYSELVEQ